MRNTTFSTLSVFLILLASSACSGKHDEAEIRASGHIEATEVRLAATVGGRLLKAPLEEGDQVATGDLVAQLETTMAEHRVALARAETDGADARLRLLIAGSRAEDLRRVGDQLGQAQVELEAAKRDLDRLEGLADRGTATEKARDDARSRRDAAAKSVATIQAQLDKLIAGPRRQEIEAARAARQAAQAATAAAAQQIADATVLAPCAGIITERVAEPGEVLRPGATIAVLTDLARPWLNVWVNELSLAHIRIDDPVEVLVDGHAQALTGIVSFISKVAEFTPKNVQTPEERAKLVFRIKIKLDNRDGIFKPGMPADAVFSDHHSEDRS